MTAGGGVDVLAILDREIRDSIENNQFTSGSKWAAELRAARAAIAELIAAAKRANGDHHAPYDCYATGPLTGDPIQDLVACPGCQLASALAALENQP